MLQKVNCCVGSQWVKDSPTVGRRGARRLNPNSESEFYCLGLLENYNRQHNDQY